MWACALFCRQRKVTRVEHSQMTKEAIAKRLREARQAAGMSQHDVGAGLNPPQRRHEISRYERNGATPNVLTIEQLAAVLNVSPCWLAFGDIHRAQ